MDSDDEFAFYIVVGPIFNLSLNRAGPLAFYIKFFLTVIAFSPAHKEWASR